MADLEDIDVSTSEGVYEVEGQRIGDTFAITHGLVRVKGEIEYDGSRWTVTHVPTGMAIIGTESMGRPGKKLAAVVAQAAVDLGFDFVRDADPDRAAERLIPAGAGDLVAVAREALDEKTVGAQIEQIQAYVSERLAGGPPRIDTRRAAKLVPAARKRRKPPPSAKKKRGRAPPEPEAVDLLALARRARGDNPFHGSSQPRTLW